MRIKKVIAALSTIFFIKTTLVSATELINIGINDKYETLSISDTYNYMRYDNNNEDLSEEVIAKRKAMGSYKVLIPKTDSKYEISLAYSDGSYSFVDSTDSFEEAISVADNIEVKDDAIPAVINKSGNIVYSTNAMGIVLVYRNNEFISGDKYISSIYDDYSTKKEYTYINQDYMDDVPIVEQGLYSAKIQISGHTGWMKTANDSGDYDLVMIPMNQVKDPSFYYVEDGFLYHYISTDMTKDHERVNDWDAELGQAPSYMKEGTKYFSYDGEYFYTGSTDIEGLNKLISDLKNETTSNAINNNNPYYNYYNLMPYRTKSEFTAEELNWVINDHIVRNGLLNSKLIGIGDFLIEAQDKYGVNATLILALAIHESEWGTSDLAIGKNNIFGLNAIDITPGQSANYYKDIKSCIMDYAKNYISKGYSNPDNYRYYGGFLGNKNMGANVKYASDPFWGEKVSQYAFKIDYRINGRDISNLQEINNYSLAKSTSNYDVVDEDGNIIYKSRGVGVVLALAERDIINIDGENYYKINNESYYLNNDELGVYNWEEKGYVKVDKLQVINKAKENSSKYLVGDINYDEKVDILDLSEISLNYNRKNTEAKWNSYRDLNKDGIIDLYDITVISIEL